VVVEVPEETLDVVVEDVVVDVPEEAPTQAQVSAKRPLHVPAACSFQVWKSERLRAPPDLVTMPLHESPETISYHWLQLAGTDRCVGPVVVVVVAEVPELTLDVVVEDVVVEMPEDTLGV